VKDDRGKEGIKYTSTSYHQTYSSFDAYFGIWKNFKGGWLMVTILSLRPTHMGTGCQ